MSHTLFYKVCCDQDDDWTRIAHSNTMATTIKDNMEAKYSPNTYTIVTVDLSGQPDLAAVYCQMGDITEGAGEWT